jgi:hypothetical protein
MQAIFRWTSLGLFLALSLFMLWFGYVYASVTDMLWFHGAAVPAELHPQFLPLYLALMNLIGGSSFALGLLGVCITIFPLRWGASWAALALATAYAIVFTMAAITAEELADATGAPTSWHIMGVLLAVTALAYGAHFAASRSGIVDGSRPRESMSATRTRLGG